MSTTRDRIDRASTGAPVVTSERPVRAGDAGHRDRRPRNVSRTGTAGLREVWDFYSYELYAPARSRISLRTFQLLIMGGYLSILPVVLVISTLVFTLLRSTLADQSGAAHSLLVIFLAANLYACGVYLLKEVFSERRFVVSHPANVGFFRALDIAARDVFVVYSAFRTTVFYVAMALVDGMFVVMFHGSVDLPLPGLLALLVLPVSLYLVTLATSATLANLRDARHRVKASVVVPMAVACFSVGYGTARLIAGPILDNGFAGAFSLQGVETLVAVVVGSATLVGCACALLLWTQLRRMTLSSFPIQQADSAATSTRERASADRPGEIRAKLRILHREVARSNVYPLIRKNFLTLSAVLLVCLGVAASGISGDVLGQFAGRVHVALMGFSFLVDIVMVALVFKVVGPTTLAAQFRFEWENLLLSEWRIAVCAASYYLLPVVVLAFGISALLALTVGVYSASPLALGIAVASAAMIGESLVAPKTMADGTSAHGTAIAFVIVLLAAPTMLAVSIDSALLEGVRVAYSICLLGGAIVCMARRIRTLPSKSAT